MLAKQGWRLLTNHTSLMSQILKAKYFPSCSFFAIFFVWESKCILNLRICRRIIDGCFTNVWIDPWLLNNAPQYLSTNYMAGFEHLMARDFINIPTRTWNMGHLQRVFDAQDVQRIIQIPLNSVGRVDFWMWLRSRNGYYFVKSGYWTVCNHGSNFVSPSSMSESLWKRFWNVKSVT